MSSAHQRVNPLPLRPERDGVSQKEGRAAEATRQKGKNMDQVATIEKASNVIPDAPLFSQANVAETRRAQAWLADRVGRAIRDEAFTETIILTPVLAELLLARNDNNRAIRQRAVQTYATDIENGNWSFNGECLKISSEGTLNDGQHRCMAVIAAGRSIKTNIAFGLTRESRLTVDQGAVRTAGNFLSMSGHECANQLAAIASLVWQFERFRLTNNPLKQLPTKVQIAQVVEAHPGIRESIKAIPSNARVARSRSVLAFCHYLIAKRAKSTADSFFLRLCLGDGLTARDPVYHCRERLLLDRRMTAFEKVEIIIRTWNATRKGQRQTKCSPVLGEIPQIER